MLRSLSRVPKLRLSRILLAAAVVVSLAAFSNATTYTVNVKLGPSNSVLEGHGTTPISDGSITGTFSADLPITSAGNITTFDFTFYDSMGNVLGTLSNSTPGDSMLQSIFTTHGCFNSSGGCDSFTGSAPSGPNFQFIVPLGFTGGNLVVDYQDADGSIGSYGAINADTAGIASGTILGPGAVPEPASLVLLASGLLPFFSFRRKRSR